MELTSLKDKVIEFRDKRNWKKFHNPKNLAISISVEANELLEIFQWKSDEEIYKILKIKRKDICEELADILIYLISFSDVTDINLYKETIKKINKNKKKYPIKKFKDSNNKYNDNLSK